MTTTILGLGGFAQSGKDSVADYLVGEYGFMRVAFADKIRRLAEAIDPMIRLAGGGYARLSELLDDHGWDVAKQEPDVRRLLQRIGVEGGRDVLGVDIWVEIAARVIEAANGDGQGRFVITDVRLPNELQWLSARPHAESIWVSRSGVGPVNDHSTENSVSASDFDRTIRNDGTLEQLYAEVRHTMDRLEVAPLG